MSRTVTHFIRTSLRDYARECGLRATGWGAHHRGKELAWIGLRKSVQVLGLAWPSTDEANMAAMRKVVASIAESPASLGETLLQAVGR